MNMAINKKTIFRLALLLFMAVATIQLTGCGPDSAPSGSTITVVALDGLDVQGPITNPTVTTNTTKTKTYRITLVDEAGLPMNKLNINLLGMFTDGQSINFGGTIGTAPVTLSTTQSTGDFGFLDFKIKTPYFSLGNVLSFPPNITATPSATGGNLADDTYFYQITSVDFAGETPASGQVAGIVTNATTTTATGSVILTWSAVPGATKYNVYGRSATLFPGASGYLVTIDCSSAATPCPNPVTYTDQGIYFPQGAAPPAGNTTGLGLNSIIGTAQATSGSALQSFNISF
jgi:hypothetical protein